jgi:hypothetical protein
MLQDGGYGQYGEVVLGAETRFLGWKWGFWGKSAINSKTFEKVPKSCKKLYKAPANV